MFDVLKLHRMIQVVCGVIADPAGRYLACLRKADGHLGGLWEFPGGKVEAGETPGEALARELREELGVEVAVGEKMAAVDWDYSGKWIRLIPFSCTILAGVPQALDHEELRWCAPENFNTLEWAPADLPILTALVTRALGRTAN